MKKFYKKAEAGTAPGGFVIRLDGKTLKTPLQNNLILTSEQAACDIAAEWDQQGTEIIPASMPLTQLVNTMVDKSSGADRAAMEAEVLKYGASDLVCYFASHPADLLREQEQQWLPLVQWLKESQGVKLDTVKGIQYHNQPEASLRQLQKIIKNLDAADFTFVQAAAALTGSVVIALAFLDQKIDAEEAYLAACVDEIYQLRKWGEDALARKRLEHIRAELNVIQKFGSLFKASS